MKYVIWTASLACALVIVTLLAVNEFWAAAAALVAAMALLVGLRLVEQRRRTAAKRATQ